MSALYLILLSIESTLIALLGALAFRAFRRFGAFARISISVWGAIIAAVGFAFIWYYHATQLSLSQWLPATIFGAALGLVFLRAGPPAWERFVKLPDEADRSRLVRQSLLQGGAVILSGVLFYQVGLNWSVMSVFLVVYGALNLFAAVGLARPSRVTWIILAYVGPLAGLAAIGAVTALDPPAESIRFWSITGALQLVAWPFFMFRWRHLFGK